MSAFTWLYDWGAKGTIKPTTRATKFGDNYEWRQAIGINPNVETWDLTFNNRDLATGNAILDFLDSMGGVTSFDWTNPRGVTGKYICREWPPSYENFQLWGFTLTFERVYEP